MEKILKIKFYEREPEYEIKEFLHELSCFACIDSIEIVKENEYKTLEQQIQELWKSRGMLVEQITAHADKGYGYWKIKAKLEGVKK